jgi:hypothetical protein
MCYCDHDDETILDDLWFQVVPDGALARSCCWIRISQVRIRSFSGSENNPFWDPSGSFWKELCRRRGYLRSLQNLHGVLNDLRRATTETGERRPRITIHANDSCTPDNAPLTAWSRVFRPGSPMTMPT